MIPVPVTFLFNYEHCDGPMRQYIMREFAAQGCPFQVLTDTLISQIMQKPKLENEILEDLEQAGVSFVDAHAPFGPHEDLDVIDEFERAIMLDRHRIAMRIAARFGVKTITIHVGNGSYALPGYSAEQFHEAIIRSLKELIPLAEELDIIICIENIWCETNTTDKLLDIIHKINSPYLGICYDAGHANLMKCDRGLDMSAPIWTFKDIGPVPYDDKILEKLLPHVVNCHLHDNHGKDDEHQLPGNGDIDWPHIMGLLAKAPRLKCIQSEVSPIRSNAPISVLCSKFKELVAMA